MRRTFFAFIVVFGVFALGTGAGAFCTWSAWAAGQNRYEAWDTLVRAFYEIQNRYVEPVEDHALVYAAMEGMVSALDRHSAFLDPEEWARMQEDERSRYFGIGTHVVPHPRGLEIIRVYADSPAERHDLRPGDVIVAVDGRDLQEVPFEEAASHIAGPRGEAVRLDVLHDGTLREISLVRDWIYIPTVDGEILSPGVALVRISGFKKGTSEEFRAVVADLQGQSGGALEGLVLDLRDNPGGLLREAVSVVDALVGEDLIVSIRSRDHADEEYRGQADDNDLECPVVVLVNGGSASAAEIVAGALRELHRAILVGTRTYGKGSVQSIWTFEDGSALKLTISRYHLPSGQAIEARQGLEPDEVIRSPIQARWQAWIDELAQLTTATEALTEGDRRYLLDLLEEARASRPRSLGEITPATSLSTRLEDDPQLARAVDLLHAPAPGEE